MNLFSQNQGKGKTITVRSIFILLICLSIISLIFVSTKKTTTGTQQLLTVNKSIETLEDNFDQITNDLPLLNPKDVDLDDFDGDGLTNEQERIYNTDPHSNDTDFDGLLDGDEVFVYFTIPNRSDSDSDGICDTYELFIFRTHPMRRDTDRDKLNDGYEIFILGSNALVVDSDYDMINDYDEKYVYNTDINKIDTDKDGLSDGMEILVYKTNPLSMDTDGDSKFDRWEIKNNRNPNVADNWYNLVSYALIPGVPLVAIIIGLLASVSTKSVSSFHSRAQLLFKPITAERQLLNLLNYIPENQKIDVHELSILTGESIETIQKLLTEIFCSSDSDNGSELNFDNVVIKSHNETAQFIYSCFYCGGTIEFTAEKCSICLESVVRCKICDKPISFNDSYATCASCGIIGKSNEVCGVLKIELICDSCVMTTKYQYI
ncbi:MAG: hypothetical protein FK730_04670 [Asgard group archaeon]|nr:hypothetical protein [Asgard group archaeon]